MKRRLTSTITVAVLLLAFGAAEGVDGLSADPAAPTFAPDTVTVELSPKNDSGVSGEAHLVHGDSLLHVGLTATGLEAGNEYPAHIHQGSCSGGGGVVAGVGPLAATSSGEAETNTGVPLTTLMEARKEGDGEHAFFLQIHLPDGTPAACGDVEHEKEETEQGAR